MILFAKGAERRSFDQDTRDSSGRKNRRFLSLGGAPLAVGLSGILCLMLLGCGSVGGSPPESTPPSAPPPPQIAAESTALAPQETPWEEFASQFKGRRGRLAIAGGAALVLVTLVGAGMVKVLRGAPRPLPSRPEVSVSEYSGFRARN